MGCLSSARLLRSLGLWGNMVLVGPGFKDRLAQGSEGNLIGREWRRCLKSHKEKGTVNRDRRLWKTEWI